MRGKVRGEALKIGEKTSHLEQDGEGASKDTQLAGKKDK